MLKTIVSKPFVKWVGGKSQLLSQYQQFFPQSYHNYFEPFVGGGAVFFHLQPDRAFLSDLNADLVNVYRCVRNQLDDLLEELEIHQERHCSEYYYEQRSLQNEVVVDRLPFFPVVDRAARFIYLNKTCFNGLYRQNKKGEFNSPIGSYKKPLICDRDTLKAASEALCDATIKHQPYHAIQPDCGDFVFLDPPYHPVSETASFTSYTRYPFQEGEQIQLRNFVCELSDRGVKVMLSNSDCPFIRDLYSEFAVHTIEASRSLNCNAEKRGKITEILVTNY